MSESRPFGEVPSSVPSGRGRAPRISGTRVRSLAAVRARGRLVPAESALPGLATLGDLLLDVVVTGERPPQRGTDVPGTLRFRAGGSAANTARAFSRLGGRATFIGAVGRDGLGRRLVAGLRADGVRVHAVTAAAPTGRLLAIVEHGERSFITERGAADLLTAEDVRPSWLNGVGALHLPAYSLFNRPLGDAAARAASLARQRGVLLSVDLASRGPLLTMGRRAAWAALAALAPDLLFATENEAAALAGDADPGRLVDLASVVVIKEGSEGCLVLWRRGAGAGAGSGDGSVLRIDVATSPLTATDTTGAGDAFAAGFLRVLLLAIGPGLPTGPGTSGRAPVPAEVPLAGERRASGGASVPGEGQGPGGASGPPAGEMRLEVSVPGEIPTSARTAFSGDAGGLLRPAGPVPAGPGGAAPEMGAGAGAGGGVPRPWGAPALRRAALGGHRAAADVLRLPRVELVL